jgi:putative spermidine/putrescine transport system substrate-binding protein
MLSAPLVKDSTRRLAVLGTSVTQNPVLKGYAEKDLGIALDLVTRDGETAQQQAALSPESFDVYDQWFHDIDLSWPTGSLMPIDINRIDAFDQISISALNGYTPIKDKKWKSSAPVERLYVGPDMSLSSHPSDQISMMPTIFNADTIALINGGKDSRDKVTDWSDLLNEAWQGAVVIQKDSAICVVEMLMALTGRGDLEVSDISDLSIEEIDLFIQHIYRYLKQGQFKGIWEVEEDLANLVKPDQPLLCSLWWSGAMQLRAEGHEVEMITPRQGYRGWFGGLALSQAIPDWSLDAAYDYLNWWLTGPAGAYLCRQGGYFTNLASVKNYLQQHEYEYWVEGKAARFDIFDNDGHLLYPRGSIRAGGSQENRMAKTGAWNTIMPEHNYLVRKWQNLPWAL